MGVILGGLAHIDWKSGIATDIGIEVGGGDFSLYELFLGNVYARIAAQLVNRDESRQEFNRHLSTFQFGFIIQKTLLNLKFETIV